MDKREWDAFQVNLLNKDETGKFILCESKEDGATRLFIHRFSSFSDYTTKNGWWDTFTIADKPCKRGYWLCKVNNFRIDRNGYLNAMVTPFKFFSYNAEDESVAWDFLFSSEMFSKQYTSNHYKERFNVEYLLSLYAEELDAHKQVFESADIDSLNATAEYAFVPMEKYSWSLEKRRFVLRKFLKGEISLEKIEKALNKKTGLEALAEILVKNFKSPEYAKYPLLIAKMPSLIEKAGYFVTDAIEEWLSRKFYEYDDLKLGDASDILARVEAVLQFREEEKLRKKEEKKAARKAKKNKEV